MRAIQGVGCALLVFASGCGGGDAARPSATAAPLPAEPAPAAPAQAASASNPDADAVMAARPSLRACYDRARATDASLGRTMVTLSLQVDGSGHVSTVDLEYKHRFDEASKTCMRDASFAIRLPPGAPRRVEVPVAFDPK